MLLQLFTETGSSEEEVRCYLVSLRDQGAARGTFKTSHYGIQFYSLLAGNWELRRVHGDCIHHHAFPPYGRFPGFSWKAPNWRGSGAVPGPRRRFYLKSRGHFGGLSLGILCARPDRATFKPGDLPMTMEMLGLMALVLVVGGVVAACFFAKNVDKAARLHRPAGEMARHH